jgi:hypothetical protein
MNKKKKVGVLYTLNKEYPISYNPGDDIVRDGQKYLLKQILSEDIISWQIIWRYKPGWWIDGLPKFLKNLHPKIIWPFWKFNHASSYTKLKDCDYLINASGPLLYGGKWFHSYYEPWFLALSEVLNKFEKPKFLNLGFGTHFHDEKFYNGKNIWTTLNKRFSRELGNLSNVNICREPLASKIMQESDSSLDVQTFGCPSLFARKFYNIPSDLSNKYIALNFHPAGIRSLNDSSDNQFIKEMKDLIKIIRESSYELKFIFHEELEYDLLKSRIDFKKEEIIIPDSIPEFLKAYGNSIAAVTSRIHGAYAATQFGVPAICLGKDSRLEMIKMFNLPYEKISDVKSKKLFDMLKNIISEKEIWYKNLLKVCEDTEEKYNQKLSDLVQ